jgi:hypothetical protein
MGDLGQFGDWRCPVCGFYRDTPNHNLGCATGRAENEAAGWDWSKGRPIEPPSRGRNDD